MSGYDRETVAALVPAIWDLSYALGMRNEREPEAGMPRSKGLKNEGNTILAHIADIRRAWASTALTLAEAQAIVLCGGMGMNYTEAGGYLGVHKSSVMRRYERGIGRLMDHLNGTDHYADDED